MRNLQNIFNIKLILWLHLLFLLFGWSLKFFNYYCIFHIFRRRHCLIGPTYYFLFSPCFMRRSFDYINKASFLILYLFFQLFLLLFLLIIDLFNSLKQLFLYRKFHHFLPRVNIIVNILANQCWRIGYFWWKIISLEFFYWLLLWNKRFCIFLFDNYLW